MAALYGIGIDVHSYQCMVRIETPTGKLREAQMVKTAIPELLEMIRKTPRPRAVVFEEGPLADWLVQNLQDEADDIVVAETRRNAYIAKEGDKSDAIDAMKLLELWRGNFIKRVHHTAEPGRWMFKRLVGCYHDCTRECVRRANQVIWELRSHGVMVVEKAFAKAANREVIWECVPRGRTVGMLLEQTYEDYDLARRQQAATLKELTRQSKRIDQVVRFTELPGVGLIRAATFFAYIDTPLRFRSKAAMHKYVGIGLTRNQSGVGKVKLGVSRACHRRLKDTVLGAAKSAAHGKDNPFAKQFRRLTDEQGKTPRIAYRTVARSHSAVMWGMFKSGQRYSQELVGLAR